MARGLEDVDGAPGLLFVFVPVPCFNICIGGEEQVGICPYASERLQHRLRIELADALKVVGQTVID
jgi:hypothetical protein